MLSALAPLALALAAAAQTPAAPAELARPEHGFRLVPPGPGWRLLDEAEAKKLQPRALAGAASSTGACGVVVVDRAPRESLREVARALIDATQLADKQVELVVDLEVDRRPAVRWMLSGRAGDTCWRHRVTLVRRGETLYRLVAWGKCDVTAADGQAFEPFESAFRLVDRPGEVAPADTSTPDEAGAGWELRGGVWQSSAHGLQLVPSNGWRVLSLAELFERDPLAVPGSSAGLVHEASRTHVSLWLARVAAEDQQEWSRWARSETDRFGRSEGESVLAGVGGQEMELRMFTVPADDSATPSRRLVGETLRGESALRVVARYPLSFEEDALKALHSGLEAVRWLPEPERAALARELAQAPAGNQVGDGYALRGGTYTDFRFGLEWKRPDGRFAAAAGPEAERTAPGAILAFAAPELGLEGALWVRPFPGVPHAEWHAAAAAQAFGARHGQRLTPPAALRLGDAPALRTDLEARTGGPPERMTVVTADHAGWAFELRVWGSAGVVARAEREVLAAVTALTIAGDSFPAVRTTGSAHYDDRMGFELVRPGADWSFSDAGTERFWPSGSMASFRREDGALVAVAALCGSGLVEDVDLTASIVRAALPEARAAALFAEPTVRVVELAGRRATELTWSGDEPVSAWALLRDRTLYVLAAATGEPVDVARAAELFRLAP